MIASTSIRNGTEEEVAASRTKTTNIRKTRSTGRIIKSAMPAVDDPSARHCG